ncbi:MAG TPA: Nramp family divalent metal transporter [Bacteroidota bacterium]|nr:Nramp family divalent metal transporter [Bacteroidota bacterium]
MNEKETTAMESTQSAAQMPGEKKVPLFDWKYIFSKNTFRYLGPAFLVSVGYMDPGNWATSIDGGARFGYQLLWVIFLSNMMAVLLQSLAAKLGIATGKDLAENCREHFSRPVSMTMWVTAELAMIATDLAEFLGAALGIYLLFKISLLSAVFITAADVFIILWLQKYGFRPLEYVIITFVSVIGASYVIELFFARPDWAAIPFHVVVPQINSESILVAIGILGATVMPHNLYLHSNLIRSRVTPDASMVKKKRTYAFAIIDSVVALNGAWFVNSAILIMAAGAFASRNMNVASIEEAHTTLKYLFGNFSSMIFAIALLASGIASSTTSTMAGQYVMEGFLHVHIRPWLRRVIFRLIVIIPAVASIAAGIDPLRLLVLSQVALSFQLPFAVIPLIKFTRDAKLMGSLQNVRITTIAAVMCTAVIIALNLLLVFRTLGGDF